MKIEAAIVDMDGTLLDSLPVWDTIGEDYLRKEGIEPKEDLNQTIRDMSMQEAAEYFQLAYHLNKSEEQTINGINQLLEDFYRDQVPLKPLAKELLQILKENGIPLVLATATDRVLVTAALKRVGILDDFEKIFTCSEAGHGKDEPAIYELAAQSLNCRPENILVLEDALYALTTAKKAGFRTAAVYDVHELNWTKAKSLADVSIKTPEDLQKLKQALSA